MADRPDTYYMRLALDLAEEGLGRVSPNPSVGCILVKDGEIIGRGRTQDGGRPHAEKVALDQAGAKAEDATAYVSLEPCFHDDKPSCSSSLIEAKISKVVIACRDLNPAIHGKGIAALEDAGIAVVKTCLEEEALNLNKGFFFSKLKNRPLVTLKIATSLDSKIATSTGESQWITGEEARGEVHKMRAKHDAILSGINTVLADDPSLTTRVEGLHHSSRRIILDTHLRFPVSAKLLQTKDQGDIYIVTSPSSDPAKKAALEKADAKILEVPLSPDGMLSIVVLLKLLAEDGVTRLMVEAGQGVFTSFLKSGLWDYLNMFRAPVILGAGGRDAFGPLGIAGLDAALRPKLLSRHLTGDDLLEIYENPL